jgi:hypothetical protein
VVGAEVDVGAVVDVGVGIDVGLWLSQVEVGDVVVVQTFKLMSWQRDHIIM